MYEYDKSKKLHKFINKEKKIFALAGLYNDWKGINTCTIVTCPPNNDVKKVHDRMPVILNPEDYGTWLTSKDEDELNSLMIPYKGNLSDVEFDK